MRCPTIRAWAIAILASIATLPASAQTGATNAPVLKCEQLAGFKIPNSSLVITKVESIPEAAAGTVKVRATLPDVVGVAVPSHCRAEGEIDQRTGIDGKPFSIGFAIALPDRWNGRFLFQGGGGLNGEIRPPLGADASGDVPALARGFAVISTDSGHQGGSYDSSFLKDQEATLNFAFASVGKVTSAGKAIIASYFGGPPKRSYFVGCSTGGREAMLAPSRHPGEFDGIVSGDPAMRTGHSNFGLAWANAAFNAIAPKDSSGKPDAAKAFSANDRKLVTKAILDTCDASDGVKDGLILNPQACRFDPASLACKSDKTDACLSPQQVGALKIAFAGPRNSRNKQVYPAFPWDSGIAAEGVAIPGILTTGAKSRSGAASHERIDVDQAEDALTADGAQALRDTAGWTNLNSFFGRGGKLLFYHGWSDPWFSPLDTLQYYEKMAKDSGGMDFVRANASRFFAVPGMGHCRSGNALDRFDMLTAVVDWVENGKAPDDVVATGAALPGRSRPLCAWPQHAHYRGQGDQNDAANFECRS
jgi:feruloyl esterase